MQQLTYLANSQMAETADELGLVEGVRSHLHTTHGLHLPVHGQEVITSDLYLEVGLFALVSAERVLMKTDGEGMGWVGRRLLELGSVSRSLDAAQTELRLESSEYKQQWPEKKHTMREEIRVRAREAICPRAEEASSHKTLQTGPCE